MTEVKQFISYINGYLDDDYREYIDFVGAEYYFTHSGCYEFAQIIKHFIPSAILYRSNPKSSEYKDKDHVIVKINESYYDAIGEIPKEIALSHFYEVDEEEETILTDSLGTTEVDIEGITIADLIIKETELMILESPNNSIDKLINTINEKNTNIENVVSNKVLNISPNSNN